MQIRLFLRPLYPRRAVGRKNELTGEGRRGAAAVHCTKLPGSRCERIAAAAVGAAATTTRQSVLNEVKRAKTFRVVRRRSVHRSDLRTRPPATCFYYLNEVVEAAREICVNLFRQKTSLARPFRLSLTIVVACNDHPVTGVSRETRKWASRGKKERTHWLVLRSLPSKQLGKENTLLFIDLSLLLMLTSSLL